ncbi:hypothetical protein ACEWB4_18340 [Sphingobium sp. sgz301303]|uniref:hypothetical protein n=1 Tax=Sphingobium sp. sgz301304 TaxID=3341828 RepID=UPI0035A722ED
MGGRFELFENRFVRDRYSGPRFDTGNALIVRHFAGLIQILVMLWEAASAPAATVSLSMREACSDDGKAVSAISHPFAQSSHHGLSPAKIAGPNRIFGQDYAPHGTARRAQQADCRLTISATTRAGVHRRGRKPTFRRRHVHILLLTRYGERQTG